MILNISKIKTEALLLFCRDLILSYKDVKPMYSANEKLQKEFLAINDEILKQLNSLTSDTKYYIANRKNFRIKAIIKCYEFINSELNKNLNQNEEFNPSMLYFSFLTLWFKELNKESNSKEYIFFTIYPYSQIYDKFLLKMNDMAYKQLNIKMIDLAEYIIDKYDKLTI